MTVCESVSPPASLYDAHAHIQRQTAADLLAFTGAMAPRAILEPGCGTGLYSGMLLDAYPDAALVGIDLAESSLAVARARYPLLRTLFLQGDAEQFAEGQYDLITANATLQWFTHLPESLRRLTGLLRDDGQITFSAFGPGTFAELAAAVRTVFGDETPITSHRFADRAAWAAIGRDAGMTWEITERTYTEVFPSLKALLLSIRHTGTRGPAPRLPWTPGRLARVEAAYRAQCGDVVATYQVFFCRGRR